MDRRTFLAAASAPLLIPAIPALQTPGTIKPARLKAGDTVGLVTPATATYQQEELDIARESLEGLGLKVKIGQHVLDRHGSLGGLDKDRAADLNRFFADSSVKAILPTRGGWGTSRLLPLLDFDLIRRNPKILMGYSDITALLNGIHTRTGLVTFHGPNAGGRWDEFSVNYVRRVLFEGESVTFENVKGTSDRNVLTQVENRIRVITPGKASGRLLGGNLTVLTAILGSPYVPAFDDAILFLEDVDEAPYRIDRMLTQLKLAGVLGRIRGFVWGTCTRCNPGEGFGSLTITDILDDHIKPLGIPAYQGAMIGHINRQFTLPVGIEVEIDAAAGSIRMLEAAVL
jgi:muramoyltetrapeptide carboxypeptidase